ncbi:hypothetical protein MGN70_000357 [Eutypa lata]|nr:hypothetical protein MGN70_000357 [Eutypa lata]
MYSLEPPTNVVHQSQIRLIAAAEEVLSILKITNDLHAALQNPILAFSTYMAATVFLEDFTAEHNDQSKDNLIFLLNITNMMGKSHPVVRLLAHQLAMDMRQCGIDSPVVQQVKEILPTPLLGPLFSPRGAASPDEIHIIPRPYTLKK